MSNELAVPAALQYLKSELSNETAHEELFLALRALQRRGLSRTDLQVHLERLRAENDVGRQNPLVEENALLALDMVAGQLPSLALSWEPAETAAIHMADALDRRVLRTASRWAFVRNDLLPPRPADDLPETTVDAVLEAALARLVAFEARPSRADFYRVPKAGFTSRPAALMVAADRLYYEGLAEVIATRLETALSPSVVWPRSRDEDDLQFELKDHFKQLPNAWERPYVVVSDLDSFYESVDHSLLATFLAGHLHASRPYRIAVEAFLGAAMGTDLGLPQGSPGSELFATAYLLPVDLRLDKLGWSWARYADDYIIAAESVADGRARLEQLEGLLRELGLRLNVSKTRIMRTETYQHGLRSRSPRLEARRNWILHVTEQRLLETEDVHEVEQALTDAGVDEDTIWAVLYHGTTPLEEVIREIRDRLMPSVAESYREFFTELAGDLAQGDLPSDLLAVEADLRECLLILASSDVPLRWQDVDTTLRWFPRTANVVAEYLFFRSQEDPRFVRRFLRTWLTDRPTSDWARAWITSVAGRAPAIVNKRLAATLRAVAADRAHGLLTREAALLGLRASGQLTQETWDSVMNDASAAIRSELRIVALQESDTYPWLAQPTAIGSGDPDIRG